jgi:CO dehydrogenase nickel-insertion accessory protein CooC1
MELTLKELLEMREALQVIFNSKTTTSFAFKILNLLTEYDAILKKIELMHNKLNKEYSEEEFQKEMQQFLTTTVAFNSKIEMQELLKENISITPFELWTIKKIMVT